MTEKDADYIYYILVYADIFKEFLVITMCREMSEHIFAVSKQAG